jgi:(1->4)-alpha-D-glucan 1-alpha-D-glucosylmutase
LNREVMLMDNPTATYRLQFNSLFGFQAARGIVPYLSELGVSDIYASPIFKATPGSPHGYDAVDPNALNPDLGTRADFAALTETVKKYHMGWLQDIIPNHMAFDSHNRMLMDTLEMGEASPFFHFFDIEWDHPYEGMKGRLLAPFLGRFYGETLESGELSLDYGREGFTIHYYDHAFPLKVESYGDLLNHNLEKLEEEFGTDHPDYIKLLGILYVLKTLPSKPDKEERRDQINSVKKTLWELYANNRDVKAYVDAVVEDFNGVKGHPESFKLLDDLLGRQRFRLSFWKVATEEINYRRFFNINGLISLRMEDEDVFSHTHALIFELMEKGVFTGLRVDHIDGLYDPTAYLERLRAKGEDRYIIVEKILDFGEQLPPFWPVQGTTGYDFMNYLNNLFCMTKNRKEMTRIYSSFTGFRRSYGELSAEKKRLIMGKHMAGDIDNLAYLLKKISSRDRFGRDITLYGLKRALVELMAQFPVYRTYVSKGPSREGDRGYIQEAVARAKRSNPGLLNELRFIERFLLLKFRDYLTEEEKAEWVHFTMRFQQFTGPLMAKGFEDTVLYVYNRFLSLNEVGGSPEKFGVSLQEFDRFVQARADLWPHALSATSTHDTKRGEDVRARINVLSEIPREWEAHIKKWGKITRKEKRKVNDGRVPDANDEYLLYQTLVGAYPHDEKEFDSFIKRILEYTIKAVREAKVHTAWLKPDTDYEEAFLRFLEKILSDKEGPFMQAFLPFQKKVSHYGVFNSLSQTLIKVTCPGVPDFYQGTDLWDLNLVDPDNRRPVDFRRRMNLLSEIGQKARINILELTEELLQTKEDGRIKLFLIQRALKARRDHRELFDKGDYVPLKSDGLFQDHVLAFARKMGKTWALTVSPRFLTALVQDGENPVGLGIWRDTHVLLPEGAPDFWRNVITDQTVILQGNKLKVGSVLEFFPVALLTGEESSAPPSGRDEEESV